MPIKLNTTPTDTGADAYTPRFFNKELTGFRCKNGKLSKIGRLNADANPAAVKPGVRRLYPNEIDMRPATVKCGAVSTYQIPMQFMSSKTIDGLDSIPAPKAPDDTHPVLIPVMRVTTKSGIDVDVSLAFDIHAMVFETQHDRGSALRQVWRMTVIARVDDADTAALGHTYVDASWSNRGSVRLLGAIADAVKAAEATRANAAQVIFAADLARNIDGLVRDVAVSPYSVDTDALLAAFEAINTYDAVEAASRMWQADSDTEFARWAACAAVSPDAANRFTRMVSALEYYPIPLEKYAAIYDTLEGLLDADTLKRVIRNNLNLSLMGTMLDIQGAKPKIKRVASTPSAMSAIPSFFSPEQRACVTSDEPLVMSQAVAGSGKSTTIKGRIDYMIAAGVKPSDITVLSFTNAAADHITDICPGVNSMTIASMVHTIYSTNFQHKLSTISTLCNSLDIYAKDDACANSLKHLLRSADRGDSGAFTRINTFVEDNYDEVKRLLDLINQTTLELEIIMCCLHLNDYVEPASVTCDHLIVDEVQDNSIFEFIYLLRFTQKHSCGLYIVGDASQTLYEFRASNPRAINIMESSGIFATYPLQTNYRSNQDILDFANDMLAGIDANRFANLRLRANSMAAVDADTFRDHVRFESVHVSKTREFVDSPLPYVQRHIEPYIDECLKRGESVCVLAYSRIEVSRVKEALETIYAGKNLSIESLVPKKVYDSCVMSNFVRKSFDEAEHMDIAHICAQVVGYICNNLEWYVSGRNQAARDSAVKLLHDWEYTHTAEFKRLAACVGASLMSREQFFDRLRKSMLDYEINANSIKQRLISQHNRDHRDSIDMSRVDIALSTIHSAKGLEFDNVVVLYADTDRAWKQESMRMYYVALTRAMRSELIFVYSAKGESDLEARYRAILAKLEGAQTP